MFWDIFKKKESAENGTDKCISDYANTQGPKFDKLRAFINGYLTDYINDQETQFDHDAYNNILFECCGKDADYFEREYFSLYADSDLLEKAYSTALELENNVLEGDTFPQYIRIVKDEPPCASFPGAAYITLRDFYNYVGFYDEDGKYYCYKGNYDKIISTLLKQGYQIVMGKRGKDNEIILFKK